MTNSLVLRQAERFEAGSGNDRIIGRGGADVFHGDAGNDYMRIRDLNFQQVAGGSGKDTLGLGGSGLNLDQQRGQQDQRHRDYLSVWHRR